MLVMLYPGACVLSAPPWGATPPPASANIPANLSNYSGYDPTNDAPDFYVFIVSHYNKTTEERVTTRTTTPVEEDTQLVLAIHVSNISMYCIT